MKHFFWPVFFVLGFVLAQSGSLATASDKPNILVIVADDLGYGDIGVHGGKLVPTPNIDALAASGVRCTNGYVSAPYCSPTRAGFLTGRYQTRFGHEFNPHDGDPAKLGLPLDQHTLADYLRAGGYTTGLVGKWHEGFDAAHHPQSRGFDDFFGFLVGGHNFILHKDAKPVFGTGHSQNLIYRGREVQHLDGYLTDHLTDEAIAFVDRHGDQPWFLYLAYNAVHTPLELLDKHKDRIPADITDPDRRGYASLLLGLDDGIGRVMAHLRETGRDKNTLIFFFSDNGGPGHKPFSAYNTGLNAPLRGDKTQTLEGGIRVPFFVVWPGKLPAGKVYEEPVIALDVLPTALTAAGAETPADCDGVDLLPQAIRLPTRRSTGDSVRKKLFAAANGNWSIGETSRRGKTAAGSCTICPKTSASGRIWPRRSRRLSPS
jgi:arylsulfatase A-like enzyme